MNACLTRIGHAALGFNPKLIDFDIWATVLTKARDMMRDKSMLKAIVEDVAATEAAE